MIRTKSDQPIRSIRVYRDIKGKTKLPRRVITYKYFCISTVPECKNVGHLPVGLEVGLRVGASVAFVGMSVGGLVPTNVGAIVGRIASLGPSVGIDEGTADTEGNSEGAVVV